MGLITNALVFAAGGYVGWKVKEVYEAKKLDELLGELGVGQIALQYVENGQVTEEIVEATPEQVVKDPWYRYRPNGVPSRMRPPTAAESAEQLLGRNRLDKMGAMPPLYRHQPRKPIYGALSAGQQRRFPVRRTRTK